jgi:hypothetical protein
VRRTPVCLDEGKESALQYMRDSGHRAIAMGGEKQAVRTLFLGRVSWHLTSEYFPGRAIQSEGPAAAAAPAVALAWHG